VFAQFRRTTVCGQGCPNWVVTRHYKSSRSWGVSDNRLASGNTRDDGGMASGAIDSDDAVKLSAPVVEDFRPPRCTALLGIASIDTPCANVAHSISMGMTVSFGKGRRPQYHAPRRVLRASAGNGAIRVAMTVTLTFGVCARCLSGHRSFCQCPNRSWISGSLRF